MGSKLVVLALGEVEVPGSHVQPESLCSPLVVSRCQCRLAVLVDLGKAPLVCALGSPIEQRAGIQARADLILLGGVVLAAYAFIMPT